MKYRLNLDLGESSIGSGVIELDQNNMAKDISDAGVRIFEISEGAEERRLKKTARKNLVRTRKRLELLAKKLFENNLWVNETPEGTDRLKAKSPYKIRHDAVYGKLENQNYIGRAILHMAKHRGAGFVSAAEELSEEVLEEGEESKIKKSSYDRMVQYLKDTGSKTIGAFFYQRLQEKENPQNRIIRQRKYALEKNIVDYAIPRYLVKDEFNQIWDRQAQYFKQMQKDGLKKEIYDILFYERPPMPYATGKCIYFREEERLLKAHPLAEMRRIYEEVNNVRVISDTDKRHLSLEERDKIVNELLLKGINAGKQSIKKTLGLSAQQKISLLDDRVIKAYLYARPEFADIEYLKNLSEKELATFVDFLAEPKNPDDKNGRLYSEDALIEHLKPIFKIDDEKEIGALLTKLPKGRGMLGQTASKLILEQMKQNVLSHREVTDALAKTDPRFLAEEEVVRAKQGKYLQLPYYGEILQNDTQPLPPLLIKNNPGLDKDEVKWGKIANPAVHMILNQIRLVVNDIIRIYGRPYDINIELGRDIGLSAKKKTELEQRQRLNEKLNDEARMYLQQHKLYVNDKNILKYKLAKEQGWKDAYNPTLNIDHRFTGVEIEHIIPQAKGGSDTYNNLCLVNRSDNLNKGDRFAYDYFAETKTPEMMREILKNARERMPAKAWRFEPGARENFEETGDIDETNRYLTDTRYVAKMALRYLRVIIDCEDSDEVAKNRILAVKGKQTAQLRRNWNLEGVEYELMGLNVPRYLPCSPYWSEINTGEIRSGVEKPDVDGNWRFFNQEKNEQWLSKPRIDHRHHALDAITIGCINRSLLQKLANPNDLPHFKLPLPLSSVESLADFRRKVVEILKEINVSHKPEHSKAGQFHKETGRTVLCSNPDDPDALVTVYKRKILQVVKSKKDLTKLLIPETIKNEWHDKIEENKIKQEKLVRDFELYMNTAEQVLIAENEQAVAEGKKEIKITESRIIVKAFQIIQEKGLWKGDQFKCYENSRSLVCIPKHGVAYEAQNNHRIDFYRKDQKIGWEVIRCFDVNQPNFVPQWKKDGGKMVWSIQQRDLLELDTPEEWKSYTNDERCLAKVKKFSAGRIAFDFISDARMTSPQDKTKDYLLVDTLERGLKYLKDHHARKIELTPFGKIKKKHKVLKDGEKAAT